MSYRFASWTLNLLDDCDRCFYMQMKMRVFRPRQPFPSLPSGMDHRIKEYMDSHRKKGTLPKEITVDNVRLYPDQEQLDVWRNTQQGLSWKDQQGNILRGALDDVLEELTTGALIPLDYKTRGWAPRDDSVDKYQTQLDHYQFLFMLNEYRIADHAYILMFFPEQVKGKNVKFGTELIEVPTQPANARNLYARAVQVLAGLPPPPKPTCEFCSWMKRTEDTIAKSYVWSMWDMMGKFFGR